MEEEPAMRVSRTKHVNKRFRLFLRSLLVLLVISGVSLGVAWAWQGVERGDIRLPNPSTAQENAGKEPLSATPEERQSNSPSADNNIPQTAIEPRERPEFPYALRETRMKAERPYFRDAVFFGDSIIAGMAFYLPLDGAAIVTHTGMDSDDFLAAAEVYYGERGFGKAYIMFGAGSLYPGQEDFIENYGLFIDAVKRQYPEAIVFVQSIPPVTADYPHIDNEQINEYNILLMRLAQNRRVHFLDVNEALLDEWGNLPQSCAPADGLHLGAEAHYRWYEYLRWHTAT
jgi:hypothetical protein